MSGSAIGFLSIGCMVTDAVEVLDDTRDEADDVMLGVLLVEVLDPSVAEAVLSSSSSSSSSSRFSANFPMLSKMTCVLGISGESSSRLAITSSKPPLRHARSLNVSKMLAPSRQASS